MSKITFILGGARSGKSAFAQNLAKEHKHVCYVATADTSQALQTDDDEMIKRIKNHQGNRPSHWQTIEAPLEIDKVISGLNSKLDIVLIDCITLYITNMLLNDKAEDTVEEYIKESIDSLCKVCKKITPHVIMVSNEVGYGIVPDNPLARKFRDIAGYVNQLIAREADNVFLVTAGIEMKIK